MIIRTKEIVSKTLKSGNFVAEKINREYYSENFVQNEKN